MAEYDSSHIACCIPANNFFLYVCLSLSLSSFYLFFAWQEFSLLQLDDVADQRVNIVGFSVFNKTHPFFQDFVLSLNRSWQENCDHAPFAGTPVSTHMTSYTCSEDQGCPSKMSRVYWFIYSLLSKYGC